MLNVTTLSPITESTALSPRPEEPGGSTLLRRRGGGSGTSPRIPTTLEGDGQTPAAQGLAIGGTGLDRNVGQTTYGHGEYSAKPKPPDLRVDGVPLRGSPTRAHTERWTAYSERVDIPPGVEYSSAPEHGFLDPPRAGSPSRRIRTNRVSSPMSTSYSGSSTDSSRSRHLPRLPIPDVPEFSRSSHQWNVMADARDPNVAMVDRLNEWRTRRQDVAASQMHAHSPDTSEAGGPHSSTSAGSNHGEVEGMPTQSGSLSSLASFRQQLRGRDNYDDDGDFESLLRNIEKGRTRPSVRGTAGYCLGEAFIRTPEARYPTLTSPNPNNGSRLTSEKTNNNLASILPVLQETSARFTHKFPWTAHQLHRAGSRRSEKGFTQVGEYCETDALETSLSAEDSDGFGMENVAWSRAQAVIVVEYNILVFATLAGGTLLLASLFGVSGTLLNSRPILAFYALLLWPSLVSVLVVGYTAYKRRTFNLDGKLSQGWHDMWDTNSQAIIQNTFMCLTPGCKGVLTAWEEMFLERIYTVVFGTVPVHIGNIVVSLLCSNHVNRTFGKGLTPRAYRLSLADVKANAEKIMKQISSTRVPYTPDRAREKSIS
ncbi:hypothetical protein FRB99_002110 [Tulasnella sp. 403]|nr:hypothetical protein FRB99_002110 [Tulasnella sp. 403]